MMKLYVDIDTLKIVRWYNDRNVQIRYACPSFYYGTKVVVTAVLMSNGAVVAPDDACTYVFGGDDSHKIIDKEQVAIYSTADKVVATGNEPYVEFVLDCSTEKLLGMVNGKRAGVSIFTWIAKIDPNDGTPTYVLDDTCQARTTPYVEGVVAPHVENTTYSKAQIDAILSGSLDKYVGRIYEEPEAGFSDFTVGSVFLWAADTTQDESYKKGHLYRVDSVEEGGVETRIATDITASADGENAIQDVTIGVTTDNAEASVDKEEDTENKSLFFTINLPAATDTLAKLAFTSIDGNNEATFHVALPVVGVLAPSGTYYVTERQDCKIFPDTILTKLDVSRYLAYENMQSFSGTWTAYFTGGVLLEDAETVGQVLANAVKKKSDTASIENGEVFVWDGANDSKNALTANHIVKRNDIDSTPAYVDLLEVEDEIALSSSNNSHTLTPGRCYSLSLARDTTIVIDDMVRDGVDLFAGKCADIRLHLTTNTFSVEWKTRSEVEEETQTKIHIATALEKGFSYLMVLRFSSGKWNICGLEL